MAKDISNKLKANGTYKLYLQLDQLPKSLNKKLTAGKWGRHSENKAWDMLIACEVSQKSKPVKPLLKANLTLFRHSHRMLDYDGLVGSLKPVVDALVSCGVLKDDSWKVTGKWDVEQIFRSKKEGQLLEIMVQESPDAV